MVQKKKKGIFKKYLFCFNKNFTFYFVAGGIGVPLEGVTTELLLEFHPRII